MFSEASNSNLSKYFMNDLFCIIETHTNLFDPNIISMNLYIYDANNIISKHPWKYYMNFHYGNKKLFGMYSELTKEKDDVINLNFFIKKDFDFMKCECFSHTKNIGYANINIDKNNIAKVDLYVQ